MTSSSFDGTGLEAVDAVLSASRALLAVAARSLADAEEEVTIPQFRAILLVAAAGSFTLNELAAALGVTAPTASRMCDRLATKRLVHRRSDAQDRRQIHVELTERGQSLFDTVMAKRRAEIARILALVPSEEQQLIARALGRFAAAAGDLIAVHPEAQFGL